MKNIREIIEASDRLVANTKQVTGISHELMSLDDMFIEALDRNDFPGAKTVLTRKGPLLHKMSILNAESAIIVREILDL